MPRRGARPEGGCGDFLPQVEVEAAAPREALRQHGIRASDIALLAQIERELYEVEEQLASKQIAERLPVSLAAKSATLAAG